MQIKIDENLPLPARSGRAKYPLAQMRKGDSFLLPPEAPTGSVRNCAVNFAKRHAGVKFTLRKTPEGYRLWRTA